MLKPRRSLAAAGLTTALLTGTAGGLVLIAPGIAGAQETNSTTTTTKTNAKANTRTNAKTNAKSETKDAIRSDLTELAKRRAAHLSKVLEPLVTDGTITKAQSDAVVKTLMGDKSDWARKGRRVNRSIIGFESAAEALGMTTEELRTQVLDGKTLAQIAESKGVSTEDLAAAMLERSEAAINKAVEAGKLTREEADKRLAALTERVNKVIASNSIDTRIERMGRLHKRLNSERSDGAANEQGGN